MTKIEGPDNDLAKLQENAVQYSVDFKVALLVNGAVVEGTITTPQKLYDKSLEALGETPSDKDREFHARFLADKQEIIEHNVKYLYLVEVTVITCEATRLDYLRVELAAVDGWCRAAKSKPKKLKAVSWQG